MQRVQGTPGEDIAILLCGYEEEVNALLRDANPGLSRRFRAEDAFRFADYSDAQLTDILREKVRAAGLSVTLPTAEAAVRIISRERMKPNFGNAGAVENALTRAKERMQSRLTKALAAQRREAAAQVAAMREAAAREGSGGGVSGDGGAELAAAIASLATPPLLNQSLLVPDDFDKNPASFDKVRAAFADLVDIEAVDTYFEELEAAFDEAREEGRETTGLLGHLVISGPPGVGKSTVAGRLGKAFADAGLLPSDLVVKQSGRTLQDRYIGGTQAKVTEILRSALGGVQYTARPRPRISTVLYSGELTPVPAAARRFPPSPSAAPSRCSSSTRRTACWTRPPSAAAARPPTRARPSKRCAS